MAENLPWLLRLALRSGGREEAGVARDAGVAIVTPLPAPPPPRTRVAPSRAWSPQRRWHRVGRARHR